jgi:hypothetical protein
MQRILLNYRNLAETPLEKCPFARPREKWGWGLTNMIDYREICYGDEGGLELCSIIGVLLALPSLPATTGLSRIDRRNL